MAQNKEYEIRKTCYHCYGSGEVYEYIGGAGTPSGTITCPVCDGKCYIVEAEVWSID